MSYDPMVTLMRVLEQHQPEMWSLGDVDCSCKQWSIRIEWEMGETSNHRSRNLEQYRRHVAQQLAAEVLPEHRTALFADAAEQMRRSDSRAFPGRGWDYEFARALIAYGEAQP